MSCTTAKKISGWKFISVMEVLLGSEDVIQWGSTWVRDDHDIVQSREGYGYSLLQSQSNCSQTCQAGKKYSNFCEADIKNDM